MPDSNSLGICFRPRRRRHDDTTAAETTSLLATSSAIHFFRWAQEAVVTASETLIPDILQLLQFSQTAKYEIEQRVAQRLIVKYPASTKGYLASAKVYRAQNNLRIALDVYEQGLRRVPSSDPQRAYLERERRETRAALKQYNRHFQQLLPYELLELIFQDLEIMDLLRCAQACQAWAEFMVEWLPFWHMLLIHIPSFEGIDPKLTLVPLFCRYQLQTLRLDGPINISLLCELLAFLADSDHPFIQKLRLTKVDLTGKIMDKPLISLLAQNLRKIGSRLKTVEFLDCQIPDRNIVVPLLTCCSRLMQVSISKTRNSRNNSDNDDDNRDADPDIVFGKMVWVSQIEFPWLTYLKLSKHGVYGSGTFWLAGILSRCPNLVHLFLDAYDNIRHGVCFQRALDGCPRLETLVLSAYAEMPRTILDHQSEIDIGMETFSEENNGDGGINDNRCGSSSSRNSNKNKSNHSIDSDTDDTASSAYYFHPPEAPLAAYAPSLSATSEVERLETAAANKKQLFRNTLRLRRYVVSGQWVSYSGDEHDYHDDGYGIASILTTHRSTLELLYLYFDGHFINARALNFLGYAPCLREIHIGTEGSRPSGDRFRGTTRRSGENLDTIFTYCPALEVIVIDVCRYYNYITATNTMLKTIATRCPLIRHIKIACPVQYTSQGILNYFTGNNGEQQQLSKLTFLEMYIPSNVMLPLVKTTPSLKTLRVRKEWSMDYYFLKYRRISPLQQEDRELLSAILKKRGGSFVARC